MVGLADLALHDLGGDLHGHAADLVRFAKAHYPDMGIGVAGYPAPHPESPSFASDWRYTVAKIREGADFVITQLFFDVREYLHFVDRLSDMGVSIPVIPGILPIQSLESIRRTLALCGANIPGKLYLALEEANAKGGAEAVRDIVAKHHDETMPTTLLLVGHGSWIVATVAVLLDMDPDDLNNVGAMRNAFWTRMTPHTDPRNADRPTWKLEEFNQGPAIASFADWENGPESLRAPGMPLWKPIIQ